MTTITIDDNEYCFTKELAMLVKHTNAKAYQFATPTLTGLTAWQLEEIKLRLSALCSLFPEQRGHVFKEFPAEENEKIKVIEVL